MVVSLNNQYNEFYEYNYTSGALKKVIKPDQSSMIYLYDEDGIFIGEEYYSPENRLLRRVCYKENGAGDYEMVEQPGNKTIFLKYNIDGMLAYTREVGFLPYSTTYSEELRVVMYDDQVNFSFLMLIESQLLF